MSSFGEEKTLCPFLPDIFGLEAIAEQIHEQFKHMVCSGQRPRADHHRWLLIFTSHTLGSGVESGFHPSSSQQIIPSLIHSSTHVFAHHSNPYWARVSWTSLVRGRDLTLSSQWAGVNNTFKGPWQSTAVGTRRQLCPESWQDLS